jgi:hypothetical protein
MLTQRNLRVDVAAIDQVICLKPEDGHYRRCCDFPIRLVTPVAMWGCDGTEYPRRLSF